MKKKQTKKIIWAVIGLAGLVYLLNFSMGIFELLPDALPIVGHIDEFIATLAFLASFKYFTKIDLIKMVGVKK